MNLFLSCQESFDKDTQMSKSFAQFISFIQSNLLRKRINYYYEFISGHVLQQDSVIAHLTGPGNSIELRLA